MTSLTAWRLLTARSMKLYFKDKMTFFMSLLTPVILLVLFITFLRSVYVQSFTAILPAGVTVDDRLIDGFTGGWLLSSILGVSSVTVAFCSNIVMIQDKVSGSLTDLLVTPLRRSTLALSYYAANLFTTLIVCFAAMGLGLVYLAAVGWYLSAADVLLTACDVVLCVLFGTALAAVVEHFVSTQGGISAVATLVSSMYGFVCGAYMPISQFATPIRHIVSFIPGTYGVGLLRNHLMGGTLEALVDQLPTPLIDALRDSFDGNLYFFDHRMEVGQMAAVLGGAAIVLLGIYVLLNWRRGKRTPA